MNRPAATGARRRAADAGAWGRTSPTTRSSLREARPRPSRHMRAAPRRDRRRGRRADIVAFVLVPPFPRIRATATRRGSTTRPTRSRRTSSCRRRTSSGGPPATLTTPRRGSLIFDVSITVVDPDRAGSSWRSSSCSRSSLSRGVSARPRPAPERPRVRLRGPRELRDVARRPGGAPATSRSSPPSSCSSCSELERPAAVRRPDRAAAGADERRERHDRARARRVLLLPLPRASARSASAATSASSSSSRASSRHRRGRHRPVRRR